MGKIAYSFSLILVSLALGYLVAHARHRVGDAERRFESLRIRLQKLVLLGFNPVIFLGAVWSLDLSDTKLLLLPLVGIASLATGLVLGFAGARVFRLKPFQAGVYATTASFTNIGNIGGLIVYILVGEEGFALVPFYKLFEEFWNYAVLFPIARGYSGKANVGQGPQTGADGDTNPGMDRSMGQGPKRSEGFLRVVKDPFFVLAFLSITVGISLNLAGFTRPAAYGDFNSVMIPAGSFLFLVTIGMRMTFSGLRAHAPKAALIVAGKAIIVPATAFALASSLGLGSIENGLLLKTILILASGPVGFLALVPPTLYKLDRQLANALWLYSNMALIIIVPVLSFLISAI